ncbi:hypothetical protein ACWPO4_04845 [Acinetobacter nosocomialis]|uniref:hypothetical protein n=1 Tax=Acinetobacter TaxID=469 RepID=UPI00044FCBC9|nr:MULTISPECIES: hypothetical protein [Acinetobacter]EXR29138.1 hypothetical protein J689_3061 [Acinetobacter sp. 1179249]MBJ8463267.1 hypothetical protein [Acinetobacter nosocomialis]MBO3652618.1 hypothetical protein [Acinetobacter bereziniae]MBP1499115.1 hypothetical protein [Acinetobacter nosocomialis]MCG9289944.1 hypothetical protein [Acinetobacter nosocomialis]
MKNIKLLFCLLAGLAISNVALAKTEQVTLKKNIVFSGEAIIIQTTKGEVILNAYMLSDKVAKQMKPFKKGQCLQIQSKNGFFKDTNDGQYIQSIQPCVKK